uniref:U3 small nucleolar RNA-associated protein 6 n=1 Tax=Panagrolaimus sp. PS1159 TaxID=55785 RepID=A0AC35FJU1_9BILA
MNIRYCTDDYMTILKIPAFDSIITDLQIQKLEEFVKAEEAAEKALSFPSAHLDKLLEALKEYSTSPISSTVLQRYKKAKEIFQELPALIDDEDKWIELVKQSDNTDFIHHSFKLQIGNNFTSLKLWQSYIEVAKDRSDNEEDYLSIYYQYCHLFVDDKDMRKKWAQELAALCQTGKDMTDWWIKLVITEKCFGSSENVDTVIEKAMEVNKNTKKFLKFAVENTQNYERSRALEAKLNELYPPVSSKNMLLGALISLRGFHLPDGLFSSQFSKPQNMTSKEKDIFLSFQLPKEKSVVTDFPKDVFSLILKNASPKLWMKLYQTRKFFFAYKKQVFCHRLVIYDVYSNEGTIPEQGGQIF